MIPRDLVKVDKIVRLLPVLKIQSAHYSLLYIKVKYGKRHYEISRVSGNLKQCTYAARMHFYPLESILVKNLLTN